MQPPYPPQTAPYMTQQPYAVAMPRQTSGMAVTSLVLGILSIMGAGVFLLPPLLAVILGHIANGTCSRNPQIDGKGLAIGGLVMGWICLAGWIVIFLFFGGFALLAAGAAAASGAH